MLWMCSEGCQTHSLDAVSPSPFGKELGRGCTCRLNLSLLISSAAALPPDVRKGLPFRSSSNYRQGLCPAFLRGVASRTKRKVRYGKPEAFRTSGGIAARTYNHRSSLNCPTESSVPNDIAGNS
ncbi:MAG: hypothetical protein QOH70_1753 [Blastocatellia bacterium]|nr:hypothetical protein [Blastocatellia bacterium]